MLGLLIVKLVKFIRISEKTMYAKWDYRNYFTKVAKKLIGKH
jgi:hypothetical protein